MEGHSSVIGQGRKKTQAQGQDGSPEGQRPPQGLAKADPGALRLI